MASPGAMCLVSGLNDPGAVFALSGKVGRSPRVFAARERDGILRQMQAAALKRMGITLAGIASLPGSEALNFACNPEVDHTAYRFSLLNQKASSSEV